MINRALVIAAAVFAVLPGALVLLASLTAGASMAFPPQGLSLRWYVELFSNSDFLDALWISLIVALATSITAIALALPAAFALVRHRFFGSAVVEAVLLSPLAVPHVVIGIGILQLYSHLAVRADIVSLTVGHLVITIPFATRMLIASLSGLDRRLEHAAASLGAPPFAVFRTVVLPQLKMATFGALVAAFIISFDDLALTIFLVQPGYATVPVLLFGQAENNPSPAIHAASVLLLVASWIGLLLLDRLVGLERLLLHGQKAR
jgi:putative spermidine/putrescine transport system permease protein